MVDFVSISSASSSSGGAAGFFADDDLEDDACSICLEPFSSQDPPTVTNCKHEYHLQCILEWSQRSKECPICSQILVLKDSASQDLLAAVEIERNLRSRRNAHHIHEGSEINHHNAYADDSVLDEHMRQHFAAAARRARHVNRRGRQRSSGIGPSQLLFFVPTGDLPDVQHMHTSPEERQRSNYEFLEVDSPNSNMHTNVNSHTLSSVVPDDLSMEPNSVNDRDGHIKPSQLSPESPQRSGSSEFLAFSESIKSKFSAASARCKESLSKSTRELKEKLLARNVTAEELRRGVQRDMNTKIAEMNAKVQREMNAKVAGVARIIERLDLTSKRTGVSVAPSSSTGGTSNLSSKGKGMQESVITESLHVNSGETANDMSSAASPYVHSAIPRQLEVPRAQSEN